jgi:hypothetical protein
MINEKDLAIVRAALHYFDEEISPNGSVLKHYLDEVALSLGVEAEDIRVARQKFKELVPRQVLIDIESSKLVMKQHFAFADAVVSKTPAQRIKFATILLLPGWVG